MRRESIDVAGPGGRNLAVEVAGPDDGEVVLVHTGTPEGGTLYEPKVEAGAARGLRHVSYARPGYAGSDRRPGRSVADCVDDVVAIADALGVGRFHTVGQSGGGPHALACAALLPDRVRAAATLGGVAPRGAEGLDWKAGMGEENLEEFAAVEAGEDELRAYLESEASGFANVEPAQLGQMLGDLVGAADRAVVTDSYAEHLADSVHRALGTGIWGWFDDDIAFFADPGFDLGAVRVPVTIWQGDDDRMVPPSHGRWLVDNVPGARPRLLAGEGHLSIEVLRYGEVLDELIALGD